jgi:SPP1 gp7 family putative phage head morphogenesis protein
MTDTLEYRLAPTNSRRPATTPEKLREVLQHGSDQGWSVDQLARGDPEKGVPGLRDLIEHTYKNRARTVARTELGNAQNMAATGRFEQAGVQKVLVLDNGDDDDDSTCKAVNGAVKSLAWARENPLEHPNCTRAFAPEID